MRQNERRKEPVMVHFKTKCQNVPNVSNPFQMVIDLLAGLQTYRSTPGPGPINIIQRKFYSTLIF